jgi:hypothetical protein
MSNNYANSGRYELPTKARWKATLRMSLGGQIWKNLPFGSIRGRGLQATGVNDFQNSFSCLSY